MVSAEKAYKEAYKVARRLDGNCPTRLTVFLQFAKFTRDVLSDQIRACEVLEETIDRYKTPPGDVCALPSEESPDFLSDMFHKLHLFAAHRVGASFNVYFFRIIFVNRRSMDSYLIEYHDVTRAAAGGRGM